MGGNEISVDDDMYDIVPPGFRLRDIKIEKAEIIKAHQVFLRIQKYVADNEPEAAQSVFFIH